MVMAMVCGLIVVGMGLALIGIGTDRKRKEFEYPPQDDIVAGIIVGIIGLILFIPGVIGHVR